MFPDTGAGKGYYHHQTGGSSAALVESKFRSTRGRRRRRRKAGGAGGGGSLDPIEESDRFINFEAGGYDQQWHDKHQQDEDKPPPPCTEFDLACFHSYAHLGIHEEMIKLEIPKQLFEPHVFNAWMVLFLSMLERSVPLEGQPTDPDLRKSWGWWKVKKWTVHILNRLYTRFGDLKLQNPENKAFAQMFRKNYAGKILEWVLNLMNVIRSGGYLPDRVTNLILQYLSNRLWSMLAVAMEFFQYFVPRLALRG